MASNPIHYRMFYEAFAKPLMSDSADSLGFIQNTMQYFTCPLVESACIAIKYSHVPWVITERTMPSTSFLTAHPTACRCPPLCFQRQFEYFYAHYETSLLMRLHCYAAERPVMVPRATPLARQSAILFRISISERPDSHIVDQPKCYCWRLKALSLSE